MANILPFERETERKSFLIVLLTEEKAYHHASEILALEHNWKEIGDESWTLENLTLDIPHKWELSHLALLEEDHAVFGYQIGSLRDGILFLNKIVVDSSKRASGAGRALIKAFLEKGLEKGLTRVRFRVRVDNPAVKFYEKLGFSRHESLDYTRKDGIASYFYDNDIRDMLQNLR